MLNVDYNILMCCRFVYAWHEMFNMLSLFTTIQVSPVPCEDVAIRTPEAAPSLRAHIYVCKTRACEMDTSKCLAFNVTRAKNVVGRWATGSTVSYFVSNTGLNSTQVEAVTASMAIAASSWASSGLDLIFNETRREEDATFLVAYDRLMKTNTYARAFFPGESRRVIEFGRLLLNNSIDMSNVFTHELGHVLGLRHEFWDVILPKEEDNVVHYPSNKRDEDSIMDHRKAYNLPLLVMSDMDRQIIPEFYDLPAGQQGDFIIEDYIPTPILDDLEEDAVSEGTVELAREMR